MVSAIASNYLVPTGREEAWRFTPLSRLAGLHDGSAVKSAAKSLYLKSASQNGVRAERVDRAVLSNISTSDDIVVQRVHAEAEDAFLLDIAPNIHLVEPIYLGRNAQSESGAELSRVRISVGAHAHAVVIVENDGHSILGEDIEILLEDGASLKFITLQEWDSTSVHVARHHAIVGRDATFQSITVSVGGGLVRLLPTVEFAGPGSSAELLGVYFATAGQHLEHRMHVDHAVPKARSRVNYKGALAGAEAHTVWIGDVHIRAEAEGTDTYELNRNLLLSDGARADSVPNLEIETGEIIGAGHASTTGRFDDEQLFYLMSRGIPMDEARRLVVRGFFAEIISQIGATDIEDRLMDRIDAELLKADIEMSDLSKSQLLDGRPVRLEKQGRTICVTRVGSEIFAIDDTCTHSDASLSEGDVTGTKIECWLHGAEFDLRTGEAITLPAVQPVRTYRVLEEADAISIEINE